VKAEVDLGVIGFPSLSHNNIVNENHELNQFVFFFLFFFPLFLKFSLGVKRVPFFFFFFFFLLFLKDPSPFLITTEDPDFKNERCEMMLMCCNFVQAVFEKCSIWNMPLMRLFYSRYV
jgi:hypothetical protein